ncbi:hypothetical protein HYH02_006574 [Chlamydomonas schloesseri]|uniref:Clp R domain-containing protein n=1 Tax=Chlamydomonas schloesseri TaxID=2026947 RepID=A0A835W801_9CHLO|nr:hypothetical protein HYH02_006574 [Chlamydomonas schloesseri]|eukprot:KAG2439046.1 hypothetical protein HYH02_006574 [Chlamydomonas schloesseri]
MDDLQDVTVKTGAQQAAPGVSSFDLVILKFAKFLIWGVGLFAATKLVEWFAQNRLKAATPATSSPSQAAASTAAASGSAAKAEEKQPEFDEAKNKKEVEAVLARAQAQAAKAGEGKLTLEHMVLALAENPRFGEILSCAEGLSEDELRKAVKKSRVMYNHGEAGMEISEPTPTALSRYGRDLTALARSRQLDPLIGRTDELRKLFNVLCRRTKNNPVVLGESGVGKTALVEGLAARIAAGDCPPALKVWGAAIIALDLGMLMAGATFPGEFEQRMSAVLKELSDLPKGPPPPLPGAPVLSAPSEPPPSSCILFIDDIHNVTGPNAQQGGGVNDASMLLKPLLARGELRCIGATTPDKFRRFIEKDPALERRFQQLHIAQPTPAEAISILRGLRARYEKHHALRITDAALVAAVELSHRYTADRFLPDKAIDLIDEAAARVKLDLDQRPAALDRIIRRIGQLEAERKLLRRSASVDRRDALRLTELEAELAALRGQRDDMTAAVDVQQSEARELVRVTSELEALHEELEAEEAGRSEAALAEAADRPKSDRERIAADRERTKRREQLLAKLQAAQEAARRKREAAETASKRGTWASWGGSGGGEVTEADVAAVISGWTGIPLTKLVASERDSLLKLGDELHRRIIGQEEAVSAVADAIHRSRAGLKDPNGPIASFLFLGPTGVGKTELAKALAAQLFNTEEAMVRLDMSEYMEKHAVSKLIGAPPGYVGFDEGGQLTEAVRRRPYTVVLFDEVEKAHVDVFNLLLQLLDDGRLSDSQGRTVSFKHTIIIMTSNLGSGEIYKATAGRGRAAAAAAAQRPVAADAQIRDLVMDQVRRHFPPEFLNRVDEFIIFEPLTAVQIRSVVALRLRGLVSRLAEKKVRLVLADSAMDYLAAKGFDPIFGARPVKRAIQRELETPLAQALLRGDFEEDDSIFVCAPAGQGAEGQQGAEGELDFRRVRPGEELPSVADTAAAAAAAAHAGGAAALAADASGPASTVTSSSSAPAAPAGASAEAASAAASGAAANGTAAAAAGGGGGGSKGKGGGGPSLPPRKGAARERFDPTRVLSDKHAAGEDITADGAEANRDDFSLPTSAN